MDCESRVLTFAPSIDEAFGISGLCFAEHGFPAGNDLIRVAEVDLERWYWRLFWELHDHGV